METYDPLTTDVLLWMSDKIGETDENVAVRRGSYQGEPAIFAFSTKWTHAVVMVFDVECALVYSGKLPSEEWLIMDAMENFVL